MSERIEKEATLLTEMIVIDYANYSGRESENRGLFRKRTYDRIYQTLTQLEAERDEAVRRAVEGV